MDISVIFSFRNEESNITELVERVVTVVKKLDLTYELIFVNDASTDNSLQILRELKRKYNIKIITMSRRFGVTPCVRAGFAESIGELVVYMDSDLQDPPELIELLYAKQKSTNANVVHTVRKNRYGESKFKMFTTSIAYRIINSMSEIELIKNAGDFKMLTRNVVDKINAIKEYDIYMRGASVWFGFNQVYIEYDRMPRNSGVTHFPLLSKGPINEFIRGLTAFSTVPLYISIIVGLFSILLSFVIAIFSIYLKITNQSIPGISGLIVTISFFSGTILISNGVISLYISKLFYEIKGRPIYVIDSIE